MALPGGYHETDFMSKFGGVPTDYQIDGYLASAAVAASTSQKSGIVTHRTTQHADVIPISQITSWLSAHS
jgi:hypothetical protein